MSRLCKILIVDDDAGARFTLRDQLSFLPEFSHYLLEEAKNVEEGLAMISCVKPDQIILDYKMPPKTGYDFLNELMHNPIYSEFRDVPIQGFGTFPSDVPEGFPIYLRDRLASVQCKDSEGTQTLLKSLKAYEQMRLCDNKEKQLSCSR